MDFFRLRTDLLSYKVPCFRMIICAIVLVLLYFRKEFLHIQRSQTNILLLIIYCVIIYMCFRLLMISVLEFYYVSKNRNSKKANSHKHSRKTKYVTADMIVKLVFENDIIEIEAIHNGQPIKMGSSSDCKHNSSKFFDKKYYLASSSFNSLDEFQLELEEFLDGQKLEVIAIDGCRAGDGFIS